MAICPYLEEDGKEVCVFYDQDAEYCARCLADKRHEPSKYYVPTDTKTRRTICTDPLDERFGRYI